MGGILEIVLGFNEKFQGRGTLKVLKVQYMKLRSFKLWEKHCKIGDNWGDN